jgi:predicted ATPase
VGAFKDLSVDLEPFTVLVGKNASGKSTVLRALRALAVIMRTPVYDSKSGILRLAAQASVADLFGDRARETWLEVSVQSADGSGTYRVCLAIDPARDRVEITNEAATWESTSEDVESFKYDSNTNDLHEFSYRGSDFTSAVPRRSSLPYMAYPFWKKDPDQYRHLAGLYRLVDCFSPFFVYRFSPAAIAQPSSPADNVGYDGSGLAAALDRLLGENRSAFDAIESDLKAQFGHIAGIRFSTIVNAKREPLKVLAFERSDGRRVPASFESDGVLLTLAYSWLAKVQADPAVGVEEPENAAYPTLIQQRVRLLESLVAGGGGRKPVQVIATTHSPYFLQRFAEPDGVRICEDAERVYQPPAGESVSDTIYTRLGWAVEG